MGTNWRGLTFSSVWRRTPCIFKRKAKQNKITLTHSHTNITHTQFGLLETVNRYDDTVHGSPVCVFCFLRYLFLHEWAVQVSKVCNRQIRCISHTFIIWRPAVVWIKLWKSEYNQRGKPTSQYNFKMGFFQSSAENINAQKGRVLHFTFFFYSV